MNIQLLVPQIVLLIFNAINFVDVLSLFNHCKTTVTEDTKPL